MSSVECGVWSVNWEVASRDCGVKVWNVVGSGDCGVSSIEYKVWSVKCKVMSVEYAI